MFNPNYEGEVVVQNGTYTAVRSKAQYTRSAFGAHWDVVLTATVDACVSGDCNSSVEFSWGCGMDAPEIDVPEIVPRSGEVATNATLSPYFYNFYDPPYNNTMTCHGTVELSYTFLKYGSFWVTTNDTEIARVNMFGPHAGTTRFEADGNVTFFAIGTTLCIRGGTCGYFRYSWGCNEAAPALGNGNLRPYTFEPACGTHNTLGLAGSVSTNTTGTECWEIACNQGRVDITFTYFNTRLDKNYMNVYEMVDGKVAEFAFHESGEVQDVTHSFSGTVILQFYVFSWYTAMGKTLEFDYVCVGGVAPPTAVPTPAPTAPPTTPAPPIVPITPTPTSAGPCTTLSALSGTVDTSLPSGAETCWTLSCVGRLQITYNPKFDGEFVVDNGIRDTLKTNTRYNMITFNAYWDVKLTAAVNGCGNSDCGNRVEFSWGCGMDAPAIAAANTTDDAYDVDRKRSNGRVSPQLDGNNSLVNTISCKGTLEMNYVLSYYGKFWVDNGDAEVFYTNADSAHFGTTRFTSDGNVSFLAQGTQCYRIGCGPFEYTWGCNMPAPELAKVNPPPSNFTPSCHWTTKLDSTGSVEMLDNTTRCWDIACEGGRVGITFTDFKISDPEDYVNDTDYSDYVNVYEMEGDEITGFPFHKSGEMNETSYTFAGSVLVQFRTGHNYQPRNSALSYNYVCMPATTPTLPSHWCASNADCRKYGAREICDTETNTCTSRSPTPGGDDGFPVGAIVGICVGGVALLVVIALLVCKNKNAKADALSESIISAEGEHEEPSLTCQ